MIKTQKIQNPTLRENKEGKKSFHFKLNFKIVFFILRDMKKIKKDVESQVDAEGIKKETEIAQGGKLTESEDSESEKNILNVKEQQKQNKTVLKRGQKSKLAKIKQKYKDQDDEDRELIMQYLAVSLLSHGVLKYYFSYYLKNSQQAIKIKRKR